MSEAALELAVAGASVRLATLGAELRSWRVGGEELMWSGDPAHWDGVAPVLFPIVGWTRDGIRVNGRRYDPGLHGFAARRRFEVETARADFARLSLRDDDETRALYPFAFGLALEYALGETTLDVTIEVENSGAVAMPYACGLHPGFAWPGRASALVRFERPESGEVPEIAAGGLFSARRRRLPMQGRELRLDETVLAREALCFLNPASRSLAFAIAGKREIAMEFSGFAHCALWTRPGAPFLCLEAWTGHGDPEGFDGDIFEKPSMRALAPGERARHHARFRSLPV